MAVVPDRREQYQRKLEILKTNRQIVLEALQRVCFVIHLLIIININNEYFDKYDYQVIYDSVHIS